MIETRKDEIRFVTDDPQRMLDKYIVKNAYHTWTEDFVDEKTGETVSVERNQILFEKGTYIDRDVLSNISFYLQSGDLKEVEVSNQKRLAYERKAYHAYPFIVSAMVGGKSTKFLLYAIDIVNAIEILKDYIELNYTNDFHFVQVKAFGSYIILTDALKPLKDDMSVDEDGKDGEAKKPDLKFYQIECKITRNDDYTYEQGFVVHTVDIDRAMFLIDVYIQNLEKKCKADAEKNGREYVDFEPHPSLEAAKPIAVSCFVPREFSEVYVNEILEEV